MAFYPLSNRVKNFRDVLEATEIQLQESNVYCGHGYESPHDEAVALVLAAAQLPITTGSEILEKNVPDDVLERLATYLERRTLAREPTAYIIGKSWLGPLMFKADKRALIPRSPLREVIETGFSPWWQGSDQGSKQGSEWGKQVAEPRCIVDVCCGGGSLGLLAAWAFPHADVLLLDIDQDALALASENRAQHALANATLQQADLLSSVAENTADIILANPPYVDADDMAALPQEYLHEPSLALAAGNDGLDLVHTLMRQAALSLTHGGMLFLEVGNSWPALEQSYPNFPFTWLTFECGGHGVCVLSKSELNSLFGSTLSPT